jgi:hypothetical protein
MITYALGRGLYVSLTNRCNATPLFNTRGPGFSITSSHFEPLPAGFEPEPHRVVTEVEGELAARPKHFDSIVFAGLGEPTLRLHDMLEISKVSSGRASPEGEVEMGVHALHAHSTFAVRRLSERCPPAPCTAQTLKAGAAADLPLRLSTNGIGSVLHARDIAPDLAAAGIAGVTVALNTGP